MRVVSLVPSWTETLLEAGVEVVGRTRFCIHPKNRVDGIPRIGGTKDWNWPRIVSLKPDLVLLDREENPKFMGEQTEIPFHATHVKSVEDMPETFTELGRILKNEQLKKWSEEWSEVLEHKPQKPWTIAQNMPGLLEWGVKPETENFQCLYLIWKDPWMSIGRKTFVFSMLKRVGIPMIELEDNYPQVDLEKFDRKSTLLLCSSEPFPFLKHRQDLVKENFPFALVNGESFTWFGLRALRFLQLTSH